MLSYQDMMDFHITGHGLSPEEIEYFNNQRELALKYNSFMPDEVRTRLQNEIEYYRGGDYARDSKNFLMNSNVVVDEHVIHRLHKHNFKPNLATADYNMYNPVVYSLYKKDMVSAMNGSFKEEETHITPVIYKDKYIDVVNRLVNNDITRQYIKTDREEPTIVTKQVISCNWFISNLLLDEETDPTDV